MGLFDFIQSELEVSSIRTIKELNKPQHLALRKSYVYRSYARYLETADNPKKELVEKIIRKETGLKFSHEFARDTYNEIKRIRTKREYVKYLKPDTTPKLKNIPKASQSYRKDEFLYGFYIYVYDTNFKKSKKQKPVKMPKPPTAIRIAKGTPNTKEFLPFFSEELLTKREANNYMLAYLTGNEDELTEYENMIANSDPYTVFSSSKRIIGFQYTSLYRT